MVRAREDMAVGSAKKAMKCGGSHGSNAMEAMECGKYARYTQEQVEILERVYNDCPKPSSSRRQQLIRECPILANIGHKQLKVWFQNRRCREKQRKEMWRLQNWNSKLNAMNELLLEENERLQKQAANLSSENQYLRQQLHLTQPTPPLPTTAIATTTTTTTLIIPAAADTSSESVVTSSPPPSQEWSPSLISTIAEEMLSEFLTKATTSVGDAIPLLGMKPGPDSIAAFALARSTGGVAAQSCGIVDLEAFKVAEIVKNRVLWLQDCRRQDVVGSFTADRGGLMEFVHTQMYALITPFDASHDFWTVRYTCCMDDGSLVICERSLSPGRHGIREIPLLPGFVRAEMLTSGCLIRPYEQGGSMVMVIDDLGGVKSGNPSGGHRPFYCTSAILARRMTCKVLFYLKRLAKDQCDSDLLDNYTSPAPLHGLSHRLMREFNDAVNCYPDDGWVSIINQAPNTVSIHIKPPSNSKQFQAESRIGNGVVCAKASLLLKGLAPMFLLPFVKERWMSWTDLGSTNLSSTHSMRVNMTEFSKKTSVRLLHQQPFLGQDEEMLEVVRIQRARHDGIFQDDFLLQLCNTTMDNQVGEYAQLVFAPVVNSSVPDDDVPLLPSGFRIAHLSGCQDNSSETLDLASSLEDRSSRTNNRIQSSSSSTSRDQSSVVTMVFQCMFEEVNHDMVALNLQQHVQGIVNDVLQQAAGAGSLKMAPTKMMMTGQCTAEELVLVQQIVNSYRTYVGQDLLNGSSSSNNEEIMFRSFWSLKHSIVCCAWKPLPVFIFANQAALDMLETNAAALKDLSLEQMFNDTSGKTNYSQPPPFIQKEGYACLPSGICLTSKGRPVSFECATGWNVLTGDKTVQIAAFMFSNWTFSSSVACPLMNN